MNCIIIDKSGCIKSCHCKADDVESLSKKCGFKTTKDFEERAFWKVKIKDIKYRIKLYAKDNGRANNENKYDFPPPVDTKLFFGSCILVNYNENLEASDLHNEDWEKVYEKLFGGFEDLSNTMVEDEEEEDELDEIDDLEKTKEGYLKDGFVVDDSLESMESVSIDSELSEEAYMYSDED
jgi:hypothetical protein